VIRVRAAAVALLLAAGCHDAPVQPPAADAYERWMSHHLHDYTVTQTRGCFCAEGGVPMRVVVRADTIARVSRTSDGSVLSGQLARLYCPVDSLFAIIRRNTSDSLVIRYDAFYGFPDTLDINPQLHPVDGGVVFITSDLTVP
jgi:hypothetical protein